jgi:hypothetical protein
MSGAEDPAEELPLAEHTSLPPPILPDPPTEQSPALPVRTILEERLLTFEWPAGIRVGDSDVVRLALLLDEGGSVTATPFFEGHDLLQERIALENLYDTHLVRAEARLDLAGAEVEPEGTVMQRMVPGEPVAFSWSIKPNEEGTVRGSVWLYLRYLPKEGEPGEELEKVIFTQTLEIQSLKVLGMGGFAARALGLLGIAVSTLIGLGDIFRFLRKTVKR